MNVKFSKKKGKQFGYYFRERISLYSCDVVERRPNLVISTSHGLLNLQTTMPSAISRFVMLMLCQFPSLSVHDSAVRTKYLYLKFIWKEKKKIEKLNAYYYVALLWSPVTDIRILILFIRNTLRSPFSDMRIFFLFRL